MASDHWNSPPPSPPSSQLPPSAHCSQHPDRVAEIICARCGDFACRTCTQLTPNGELYCARCASLGASYDYSNPIPWEQRDELGFVNAFWGTVRGILFDPVTTLQRIDPQGPWGAPLLFLLLASIIMGLGAGGQILAQSFALQDTEFGGQGFEAFGALGGGALSGVLVAVLSPFILISVSFLTAGILHLCARIVGAGEGGYRATWRMLAYVHSLQVVTGVMGIATGLFGVWHAYLYWGFYILSQLVSLGLGVYALVLWVFGIREVHRTTTGRALGAVGVFFGALMLLCCGAYALIIGIVMLGVSALSSSDGAIFPW